MRSLFVFLGITVWIAAAGFGYVELVRYENAPGDPPLPPARWPSASAIHRSASRPTLVMVVHPLCSCSRASIDELAVVMTQAQGRADAYVLFFQPEEFSKEWSRTALWTAAAAIPGVQVRLDEQAKEAQLFRAPTSGSVLLYDRDGFLIFKGGITASRSHEGDNAGQSAVVAMLTGGKSERTTTFVFGCSILDHRKDGASQ